MAPPCRRAACHRPGDIASRALVTLTLRGAAQRLKSTPYVLLMYDPSDRRSFKALRAWKHLAIDALNGGPCTFLVVAVSKRKPPEDACMPRAIASARRRTDAVDAPSAHSHCTRTRAHAFRNRNRRMIAS